VDRTKYDLYEAVGPTEASRVFLDHEIDAVILNLRRRHVSGVRFLERLRNEPNERAQAVPVFVLTGSTLTADEQAALGALKCSSSPMAFMRL
jgi:CheY-like chemotaxis protein